MQIKYKTFTMTLEELPLDVGYASEKVKLLGIDNKEYILGGHNGKTQLFITTSKLEEDFLQELKEIQELLPQGGEYEVTASLIVPNPSYTNPNLSKIDFYIDAKEEFGDFYSVRLKGEPYNNQFTKALILVSKDGAIFYDEFLSDLENKFNLETLYRKIVAAQTCYTGKGCH